MQAELLELLDAVDMDGNHKLDYSEFLAATMEKVRDYRVQCPIPLRVFIVAL